MMWATCMGDPTGTCEGGSAPWIVSRGPRRRPLVPSRPFGLAQRRLASVQSVFGALARRDRRHTQTRGDQHLRRAVFQTEPMTTDFVPQRGRPRRSVAIATSAASTAHVSSVKRETQSRSPRLRHTTWVNRLAKASLPCRPNRSRRLPNRSMRTSSSADDFPVARFHSTSFPRFASNADRPGSPVPGSAGVLVHSNVAAGTGDCSLTVRWLSSSEPNWRTAFAASLQWP